MELWDVCTVEAALALVVCYVAWRHDSRDWAVGLLILYWLVTDLASGGLVAIFWAVPRDSLVSTLVSWGNDVLFVMDRAIAAAVAGRYLLGCWPKRVALKVGTLALAMAAAMTVHRIQRHYFGLGPWDISVRWVALHGLSLLFCLVAGYRLIRIVREQEVAPAHLLLILFILLELAQLITSIKPGAWNQELYRASVVGLNGAALLAYAARLARNWLRARPASP